MPDYLLAKAVESSVFQTSMLAYNLKDKDPRQSQRWMRHADKLESKYTTEHGEHYSATIARGMANA